jgi:hypothetical protein
MEWGDLPGDSASNIADAQGELDHLTHYLDTDDDTLEMMDVQMYLEAARGLIQSALDAIDAGD